MRPSDPMPSRLLVLPLQECAARDVTEVGAKARTLGRLMAEGLPVPEGICLTTFGLQHTLGASGVDAVIDERLAEAARVPATLGAQLAAVRGALRLIELPTDLWDALQRPAQELLRQGPVVVRSSAPGEDGSAAAAAGVYESVRDVADMDSLARAIRDVWASLFTEQVNYYRHGSFLAQMAVVVQAQVAAQHSGVLFTRHPISGRRGYFNETSTAPDGVTAGTDAAATAASPELERLADQAERVIGAPVDMEYASTATGLVILQARPVTSDSRAPSPAIEGYRWASQEDVHGVRALPLGACASLFMRQLVKHVPYRQLCRSLGIPIYDIYYLAYQWDAVSASQLAPFLDRLRCERVSVNWGTGSGPSIPTVELSEKLWTERERNVVAERTTCARVGTIVPARIAGNAAAVSNGNCLVEAFLPRDRTSASAVRYLLDADGRVVDVNGPDMGSLVVQPEALTRIGEILTGLSRHLGEVRLEWYVSDDDVYVKDLTIEREPLHLTSRGVLSPGALQGPALVLEELDFLTDPVIAERVSVVEHEDPEKVLNQVASLRRMLDQIRSLAQPPVIVANFPALGLIPLASHAAGFVFERGNLLCHTAIVLREKKIPAFIMPGALGTIRTGEFIRMDVGA
ncbi:PEP/pyruvate-binding domain-containing protein [Micromonospora sediminicola]|uniref:PEP/pyruvate-binding domain-containing protein n=1 Tax=Micromonospora sediminicola TaxID=946078 RepID=UPI00378D8221